VRDHEKQALAYVYHENESGRRSSAKPLTRDEAFCAFPAVAFSSASAKIRAPGAEDRRLRRLTHGDTRGAGEQGGPDPLDTPPPRAFGSGPFLRFLLAIWDHGRGKHHFDVGPGGRSLARPNHMA
jgi:hypothetical protein